LSLILKNGIIVNPDLPPHRADIMIKSGKISKIGKIKNGDDKNILDISGNYVFPGVIDMHSHLREPGDFKNINIENQTYAAVSSGITRVVAMPNTAPVCDNLATYKKIDKIIKKKAYCKVNQVIAGSKDLNGEKYLEFDKFDNLLAVSDDGKSIDRSDILENIFENVKKEKLVYLSHAEDMNLRKNGVVNSGIVSKKFDLDGIDGEVEDIRTYRDAAVAGIVDNKLHFCHLSTEESLKIVERFKKKGLRITCEVTPHHIALCEEDIDKNDGNYKMNPPLRSKRDQKYLIQGIKKGSVDVIATDHAPHPMKNKNIGLKNSSFGIIGFETFIPIILDLLHYKNGISLSKIAKLISFNPAKILSLENNGLLKKGYNADLTIINMNKKFNFTKDKVKSKTYNSPFIGKRFQGTPIYTVVDGKIFDIERGSWYDTKESSN